jgi:excisionase family DNA binding protein
MARQRGGGGRGKVPAYLSTAQVAKRLEVSTARVRQLALAGDLRETMRVGERRLFKRTDVERYMRVRTK